MATIKETLIEIFNLEKMPAEEANEMAKNLAELVFQSVLTRILPKLSQADMEEYEDIVEVDQDPEILFSFLQSKVPGFEKMILDEAKKLHTELSTEMEALNT